MEFHIDFRLIYLGIKSDNFSAKKISCCFFIFRRTKFYADKIFGSKTRLSAEISSDKVYAYKYMSTSFLGKVFEWNKMASLTNLLKMFEEF